MIWIQNLASHRSRQTLVLLSLLFTPVAAAGQDQRCSNSVDAINSVSRERFFREALLDTAESFSELFWSEKFERIVRSSSGGLRVTVPFKKVPVEFSAKSENNNSWELRQQNFRSSDWNFNQVSYVSEGEDRVTPNAAENLRALAALCAPSATSIWWTSSVTTDTDAQVTFSYSYEPKTPIPNGVSFVCSGSLECAPANADKSIVGRPLSTSTTVTFPWKGDGSYGDVTLRTTRGVAPTPQLIRRALVGRVEYDVISGTESLDLGARQLGEYSLQAMHNIRCLPPELQPAKIDDVNEVHCVENKFSALRRHIRLSFENGESVSDVKVSCIRGHCTHIAIGPAIYSDGGSRVELWVQNHSQAVSFKVTGSIRRQVPKHITESAEVKFAGKTAEIALPLGAENPKLLLAIANAPETLALNAATVTGRRVTCTRSKEVLALIRYQCTLAS